jgi:hypothetical protein
VVFIIAQIVEDYVLTPKLIGTGSHCIDARVRRLIIGGELFGLLGLVLFPSRRTEGGLQPCRRDLSRLGVLPHGQSPPELPAPADETAPEPSTC